MSQLELILEKAKKEVEVVLGEARKELVIGNIGHGRRGRCKYDLIKNLIKIQKTHLKAREKGKHRKFKIKRNNLEIEYESLEISRELDFIQETMQYSAEIKMPVEMAGLYKEVASYSVSGNNGSTTYQLFEYNSGTKGGYGEPIVDVKNQVPGKNMEKLNLGQGLWGFTYLGSNYMAINQDLDFKPAAKEETMLHEDIHTNDEYETRVLTWWMMKDEKKYMVVGKVNNS